MNKKAILSVVTSLSLFAVHGCSTTTEITSMPTEATSSQMANQDDGTSDVGQATKPSIAPETLYDLLIAEMGGKVNRLEIALGNYMRQAHLTKDPAVIERYALIASYMQAHQATLDATKLWLEVEPNNVDALHLMLAYQISQKNGARQEAALRDLLQQTNDINLLLIEQQLNATSDSQRLLFHDVITKVFADPDTDYENNAQLWYLKAKTNSLTQRHDLVITDVEQLQKLEKKFMPGYILLVDAYEKTGQLDEAEQSLKRLTRLDPDNKKIRIYYARLLVRQQKMKQANAEFADLLNRFPDDLDLKLTAAALAIQANQFDQAMSYLDELLRAGHRTNEVLIQMALVYGQQDDTVEAINKLLQVTPSPFFQEARLEAARLQAPKDIEAAIDTLQQAAQLQPKAQLLYTISIAELLAQNKQADRGLEYLNDAIAQSPREPSLLYSRAILNTEMDNFSDAETDLRKVLKLVPDNVAALNALGYTLADRDTRLDEAKILLDKALLLSPNDPPILDSMGWLEYRQGNLHTARQLLEKAYKLMKDHEIAAHLGEVLWFLGEKSEAQQIWQEGLELKPDSVLILKTLERLNVNSL